MQPTGHRNASFSPYHDDDRLTDFLDDDAQRFATNAIIVFLIHVGLAFSFSSSFIIPDLKPPKEPDAVTVEIITFDPAPVIEEPPAPVIIEPVVTPPPPEAVPKPQPKPQSEPTPPPIPEPVVEPEPLPEPVFTPPPPPPPEVLAQPKPADPEPLPVPEPLPLPEPLPEPEPTIEIFEPLPEPIPQPVPEPLPEPITEPSITIYDPRPVLQPNLEPIPEPTPNLELYEPEPEPLFDPIIIAPELPPTPGIIEAAPLPEVIEPEPLPPEIIIQPEPLPEPLPEPVPEPLPEPEPRPAQDPIATPELILTAPTVLASPEAPKTRAEERRAVPQEQSDPFIELLKKDRNSTLNEPVVTPPRSRGGGNEAPISGGGSVTAPQGGGTQIGRTNRGSEGWTLSPQPTAPGNGYDGLALDIRCREEGRTHEDCPEYVQRNRGRDHRGRENFEGHAGTGADRGDRISDSRVIPSRRSLGLDIGDPSINSGVTPSINLDELDARFREDSPTTVIGIEADGPRLRDKLAPDESTIPPNNWILRPQDNATPDKKNSRDWVLETPPE